MLLEVRADGEFLEQEDKMSSTNFNSVAVLFTRLPCFETRFDLLPPRWIGLFIRGRVAQSLLKTDRTHGVFAPLDPWCRLARCSLRLNLN